MKLIKIAGLAAMAVLSTIAMASAADKTPAKVAIAPPPAPAPIPAYDWSGGYVSFTAGYGWGQYTQFDGLGDGVTIDPQGFIGGVGAGYNMQLAYALVGLEADVSKGPGQHVAPGTLAPVGAYNCTPGSCDLDVQYFGTVRARVGAALGNFLLFGTGGYAFGHVKGGIESNGNFMGASTKSGWTAGGGAEYAFTRNLILKAEYLYVDLGTADLGFTGTGNRFEARGTFSVARLGLDLKY